MARDEMPCALVIDTIGPRSWHRLPGLRMDGVGSATPLGQDNCLRLAASLASYTALSLAPLVLLIVGVVGLVLDLQQVAPQLTAQLEGFMGPAGRELITSILAATSPQGGDARDHRGPGHAVHWRRRRLRRAPGDAEPHLGGPASPDQQGVGGELGLAPPTRLLVG